MYKKILVALENGRADDTLVPHIAEFARRLGSELLLVHVADGWAARNYESLKLAESSEIKEDRAYLESVALKLRESGAVDTGGLVPALNFTTPGRLPGLGRLFNPTVTFERLDDGRYAELQPGFEDLTSVLVAATGR